MNKNDDFTMVYQDSAAGLTLLLLHGFPLSSAMWEPQIEGLGEIVRVIAPDLRGLGESDSAEPPYSLATLADDCAALLDALTIDDPVVVCGMSMGGYLAFEFYRRYPERVAALILTATRAGADSEIVKKGRDIAAADVHANGVAPLAGRMAQKLFAPAVHEEDPDLVTFVTEMMADSSINGVRGCLAAMRDRPDSTPDLAAIAVPTLVVHGDQDLIINSAEAEAMADTIPGAALALFEGVGHMVNLEAPEAFNDVVQTFLQMNFGDEDVNEE